MLSSQVVTPLPYRLLRRFGAVLRHLFIFAAMKKQVNTIQTSQNDFIEGNLFTPSPQLLFALILTDFNTLLCSVLKSHVDACHNEIRRRPHIYIRIIIGIHLGYNRQQLALLISNGWTIRINALLRLGYAKPLHNNIKEAWEQLVLTEKGINLYNDLMQSIERYLNGLEQPIPWVEYKKRGLNKRLAPKQKENK